MLELLPGLCVRVVVLDADLDRMFYGVDLAKAEEIVAALIPAATKTL